MTKHRCDMLPDSLDVIDHCGKADKRLALRSLTRAADSSGYGAA